MYFNKYECFRRGKGGIGRRRSNHRANNLFIILLAIGKINWLYSFYVRVIIIFKNTDHLECCCNFDIFVFYRSPSSCVTTSSLHTVPPAVRWVTHFFLTEIMDLWKLCLTIRYTCKITIDLYICQRIKNKIRYFMDLFLLK